MKIYKITKANDYLGVSINTLKTLSLLIFMLIGCGTLEHTYEESAVTEDVKELKDVKD